MTNKEILIELYTQRKNINFLLKETLKNIREENRQQRIIQKITTSKKQKVKPTKQKYNPLLPKYTYPSEGIIIDTKDNSIPWD